VSKEAKNCGTVNGEHMCLDSVPSGDCMLLGGGGAVCTEGAAGVPTDGILRFIWREISKSVS
jgi:hypothetical protein